MMADTLLERSYGRSPETIAIDACLVRQEPNGNPSEGLDDARLALADFPTGTPRSGTRNAVAMAAAHLDLVIGGTTASATCAKSRQTRTKRGHASTRRLGEVLIALGSDDETFSRAVEVASSVAPWHLTFLAEDIASRLADLSQAALQAVQACSVRNQERWRTALRRGLDRNPAAMNLRAARLLEQIGEPADIGRLRRLARQPGNRGVAPDLGRQLAHRLAPRVYLEDQESRRLGYR